jgi:hypothetical protein
LHSGGAEIGSDGSTRTALSSGDLRQALDLTVGRRGLAALSEAIEGWVQHLLAVDVAVEPLKEMRDVPLRWYIGLDAEATRIGDALWYGEDIDDKTQRRVVGLFRLTFNNSEEDVSYLILAMTADKMLRMKPQNLLVGLPARLPAELR